MSEQTKKHMDILNYKGFKAKVNYSKEDDIYYGTVLDIKDCVCFEIPILEKAEIDFQNAIDDYLQFCKDLKKEKC